jgi:hypothetical protein
MARKKGSKNKKKAEPVKAEEEKSPYLKEAEALIKAATPKSSKPTGHGLTVKEDWKPSPDMGEIKAPPASATICECLHQKAHHYGPDRDWCNVAGCQCQSFNERK